MSWYEQAQERLERESREVTDRYGAAMKGAVREALLEFCRQDGEFAQAVAQGGSFKDCMAAVAKGVKGSISDLEAYRRAAAFYFHGAQVQFSMTIRLAPAEPEPDRGGIVLDLSDFF